MMAYITGSKPEYPWDKGCQEIEKYRMAILDDDMFFHIALMLSIITDYVNNKMWMNSNILPTSQRAKMKHLKYCISDIFLI